jgi:hypothetical protein
MPLADIDGWQTHMLLRTLAVGNVSLYSEGLKGNERTLTGVQMVESIEDAIATSMAKSGDKRIAIIPEGPYVIPTFTKTA